MSRVPYTRALLRGGVTARADQGLRRRGARVQGVRLHGHLEAGAVLRILNASRSGAIRTHRLCLEARPSGRSPTPSPDGTPPTGDPPPLPSPLILAHDLRMRQDVALQGRLELLPTGGGAEVHFPVQR